MLLLAACASRADDRPSAPSSDLAGPGPDSRERVSRTDAPGPILDLGAPPQGPLEVVRDAARPAPQDLAQAPSEVPFEGLEEKWRTRIGKTTYRGTIQVLGGRVLVSSNGEDLKSTDDRTDVVWILDAASGEEVRRLRPPGTGEKDCNGVAADPDMIVFGTDQGVVYRYGWDGSLVWKHRVDEDVEAAPALVDVNGDGSPDVLVGSEGGYFYALDGKSGKALWRHRGGKGDYDQRGFVGSPAIIDVDADRVSDVLVPSRDQVFRALSGSDGRLLWSYRGQSGMHGSPIVVDVERDGAFEVVFTEAYRMVYLADADTGRVRWSAQVGLGLKGAVGVYPDANCVVVGTAWSREEETVTCLDLVSGAERWRWTEKGANITSGFVVGDVDGRPGQELVFGTEAGRLVVLGAEGQEVWSERLGGPVECTPTLADLDKDGRLDILVAANDGFLRAFGTAGLLPPAVGYHRGNSVNWGVLEW